MMTLGISKQTLGIIGVGIGGAALGGAVGYYAASRRNKKRKSKRKTHNHNTRKRSAAHSRRIKGRRYTPYTARKRPDTSRRRIRYTKNGQPYIIEYKRINGHIRKMARFISRKSAKASYKRAGGRY